MARRSRKNIMETVNASKAYRVAAYVRLSVLKPNESSNSGENQKKLISDYVEKKTILKFKPFILMKMQAEPLLNVKGFKKC